MVDTQFGQLTDKILAAIKTRTDKPVQVVLTTHTGMGTMWVATANLARWGPS